MCRYENKVGPTEVRPAWRRAGSTAAPEGCPGGVQVGAASANQRWHQSHTGLALDTGCVTGARVDLEEGQVPARLVGSERRVEAGPMGAV